MVLIIAHKDMKIAISTTMLYTILKRGPNDYVTLNEKISFSQKIMTRAPSMKSNLYFSEFWQRSLSVIAVLQ
jgi:hypothetical protein